MNHPARRARARTRTTLARAARVLPVVLAGVISACGGGADAPAGRAQPQAAPALASPAYFVSTTGSDSGDGSQAHPWRTFNHAAAQLKAGDTLYAYGGVYAERGYVGNSGTAAKPITITAYPGQQPVIDAGSLSVPSWSALLNIAGSYVTVSGFELRNINVDGHGGQGGSAVVQGGSGATLNGTGDTIANMTIHDTWVQGVYAKGDGSTIEDTVVHDVAMSNCRAAGRPNCSPAGGGASGWASCVSIASDYGSGRITHGGTIQRTEVRDCWGEGMSTWRSDGVVLQDNLIHDNWAQNLYVNNATHVLVQRNFVYNTPGNLVGKTAPSSFADEYTSGSSTSDDAPSSAAVVVDNVFQGSPFSAFGWTIVPGTGLVGDLIANNTFVELDPTLHAFATGGPGNKVVNSGTTIANNLVVGATYVPAAAGLAFSHDLWTSPPPLGAGPGDVVVADASTVITQAGPTAPPTTAYVQLTPASPASGAGTRLPQVTTNDAGLPFGTPPDIGAF